MNKKLPRAIMGVLLALVILAVPKLMPDNYYVGLANLTLIYIIVAIGLNFIYGYTGYISFAQAGFFGIGAYTAALLAVDFHINFWVGLPVSGLVASIFGIMLGLPALKLSGHYLAMATIGFGIIVQMVLQNWTSVTHGASGIGGIPGISIGGIELANSTHYYYFLLLFAFLTALVSWCIEHSNLGRSFKAVREDEIAASTSGINLTFTKVFSFALSAFFAGIAGSLYAHMSSYISPDTFTFDQSIVFFTMVLIGGAGTVTGPIIGAVLLTFIPELLRFLQEYYMALFGIGIVLVMLFIPQGIVSFFAADGKFMTWLAARSIWGSQQKEGC
ncbi:MAG: branched-chain amino acid ABC transporter permease [Negativicutes bacterium]|nr:branched-chain amino acid ABC transporter permease [Negativicutes bacterium]